MLHACDLSTPKTEAGGSSRILGQHVLHSEFKVRLNYMERPGHKKPKRNIPIFKKLILFLQNICNRLLQFGSLFLFFLVFSKLLPCRNS